MVVEEGELSRLLEEAHADLEANLLDEVNGLDGIGVELLDTVDELRILDVARGELRREAPVRELVPHRQRDHSVASLPNPVNRLEKLRREGRRPGGVSEGRDG